jgi:nicotinate-nucleotide adenylyltransferase
MQSLLNVKIIRHPNCSPDANPNWQHIAIVGGTFDPPHWGHSTLIKAAQDSLKCDLTVIRPCNGNPLKTKSHGDFNHRVEMCDILFGDIPGVEIFTFEQELSYPTYSYVTVQSMFNKKKYGNAYYHFMVGEDCFESIEQWKNLSELFAYANIYAVGPNVIQAYERLPEWIRRNMGYVQMHSVVDIHSTQIRNQVSNGKYDEQYTSINVLQYIREHNLYR